MKLLQRIRALFRRRKLEAEMDEEMRIHLEMLVERNRGTGMSEEEARFAARREFGGVEQIKEQCRDMRRWGWVEDMVRDVGFALRSLRKTPGYTVVAVLTLALGIGMCTAMFSVIDGVLLRPLALQEPGRLVELWEDSSGNGGSRNSVSGAIFKDWREQTTLLEHIAAELGARANLGDVAEPVRLEGMQVSTDFLKVLGLGPRLGRDFLQEEGEVGAAKAVLISEAVWRRSFGSDTAVIGRVVRIGGELRTVIGVMPTNPTLATGYDFIVPFVWGSEEWHERRGDHRLRVLARLKSGVSLEQALAELQAVAERNRHLNPSWKKDWGVMMRPLRESMTGEVRPALVLLSGAVVLVLLIACANLANLLLAKAAARRQEIAVRMAIGGSRRRIVRLLLTESVVLALAGGVAGLLVGWGAVGVLGDLNERFLPRAQEVAIDGRVLGFTIVVALLTGLVFGAAPAWQLSRGNEAAALGGGGRTMTAGNDRLRSALMVGQMALALMLTIAAGLVMKSVAKLLAVSPGFATTDVLTASVSFDANRFPGAEERVALFRKLMARAEAEPGVAAMGFSASLPMLGRSDTGVKVEGRTDQPEQGYFTEFVAVAGEYFSALGITVLSGRGFADRDFAADAPPVVVVNQALVRELFGGENPVGRRVQVWGRTREVVGVVNDVRHLGLDREAPRQIYLPELQHWQAMQVLMRAAMSPEALRERVRAIIAGVDPQLPIGPVRRLDFVVVNSTAARRLMLVLLSVFAGTALLLAALGLAGVMAYAVACRTREFGIRLALGATRAEILRLVLSRGAMLTGVGALIGLAGAFVAMRLLRAWLFETEPSDPLTFVAVTLILAAVSLGAGAIPARRAAKVDPMVTLRAE